MRTIFFKLSHYSRSFFRRYLFFYSSGRGKFFNYLISSKMANYHHSECYIFFPLSQEGFLIAPDTNKSENLVTGNSISYSLTIIYNVDNFEPFLSNKVKVFAWQKT